MSLRKFINCTNDLIEFEKIYASSHAEDNIHALQVLRVELDSLWTQVKRSYEECRDIEKEGDQPVDKTKLRERYQKTLSAYKTCLSSINAEIFVLSEPVEKIERQSTIPQENETLSIRLPPCDTDTFFGDYKLWPSFRDLFTAIYIKNSRLSNVERLFYLTQKTGGEAREIIAHVPLTNDGFILAWKNLIDRYENKWMQVNEQYKIILDLPQVSVNSGSSIKKLQRTINDCRQTLNMLGIDTNTWESFLIYICSQNLPRSLVQEFENSRKDCAEIPTWVEFDKFLTHKFKTLESVENIVPKIKTSKSSIEIVRPVTNKKSINTFQTNLSKQHTPISASRESAHPETKNCQYCKDSHVLRSCPSFLEKNVSDRIHIVRTTNSCYNCLSAAHSVRFCPSKYSCRLCKQKHNTLLHKATINQSTNFDQKNDVELPSTSSAISRPKIQSTPNSLTPHYTSLTLQKNSDSPTESQERDTLLFTAVVQIEVKGLRYQARAIIDPGSQSTFVSDKLQKRLNLPTKRNLVHVTGLNQTVSETSTKACLFNLCSRVDPSFKLEVWAPVLKTLPQNLPTQFLNPENFKEAAKLELADPHFYKSRPIDLLIGLDLGPSIYCMETPMRSIGSILAQKTAFGWIVGGPISKTTQPKTTISLLNTTSLDQILTRFWEVEETPKQILRSDEDTFCESNFKSTTRRNDTGRYIVTLPFKKSEEIGSSRNIAMAQYLRMERMLSKKPEIEQQYHQVILEYLELGQMKKISPSDINKAPNYYLPHHAVIKPDRLTTKLRVVFNASSPTSNKNSLNDILYPGPILQQDLVLLIAKWRFFRFVFNADITKMYRQILIDPSQTPYQRILFRKSPNDPIEDYELLTVTFGVNCAPFLAIRTLLQLAEEVQSTHPLASKILQQNMYVDDVLAANHTSEETIKSRKELTKVLASAGFDLMKWNISSDSFTFTAPDLQQKEIYIKQEALLTVAKSFDQRRWRAPITADAKLILQQIWLDKIGWNESLKQIKARKWKTNVKNYPLFDFVKIRLPNDNSEKVVLYIRKFIGHACLITNGCVYTFVFFAIKAIHFEAPSYLLINVLFEAFSLFIGRSEGPALPKQWENFRRRSRTYKKNRLEFVKTLQNQMTQYQRHQKIKCKFITPAVPPMGIFWKAAITSFNRHLQKMILNINFTFEELSTMLTRIEACLTSRLLSPASDDPNDLTPLTPGHFFIGTSIIVPTEQDLTDMTLANRWKRNKIIYKSSCQIWKFTYLTALHHKPKWKFPQDITKMSDLVIIKQWKFGRVIEAYPGHDNTMRVVDIRTAAGICTRPITTIIILFHTKVPTTKIILLTDMSSNVHLKSPNRQWSCRLCKKDATLRTCQKFLNAKADKKYDVVVMQSYCINYFTQSHLIQVCKNECRRRICRMKMKMTQTDPFYWPNAFVSTATALIAPKKKRQLLDSGWLFEDDLPRRPYIFPIKANRFREVRDDTLEDINPKNLFWLYISWTRIEALPIHTPSGGGRMFRNTLKLQHWLRT